MSTGQNCQFVEAKPGNWYLILELFNAPKNAWDWRDWASCYGPFSSALATRTYLDQNFANPGGSDTIPYTANLESDSNLQLLIARAYH